MRAAPAPSRPVELASIDTFPGGALAVGPDALFGIGSSYTNDAVIYKLPR